MYLCKKWWGGSHWLTCLGNCPDIVIAGGLMSSGGRTVEGVGMLVRAVCFLTRLKWTPRQSFFGFLSSTDQWSYTDYLLMMDNDLAFSHPFPHFSWEQQFQGGSPVNVKHQLLKVVQRIFQYHVLLTGEQNLTLLPSWCECPLPGYVHNHGA